MSPMHNNEEITSSVVKILTSSTYDNSEKVKSIQNLKAYFKPPEKIFKNIKLKSLLQEGKILLESNIHKNDFLITYGARLINFIGKDTTLDSEIFSQLDYILTKLQEPDESLLNKLYIKVCQLQSESFLHFCEIVKGPQIIFERKVVDWIENNDSSAVEFLARASANSSKLFLIITSILYSILVKTLGHWRVLEATASFISSVISVCLQNGKNFLCLYPENCRRVVSLLIVSPELYSDEMIKNEVLSLLKEIFLLDRKKILILLSHYPLWLCDFKSSLIKSNV